MKAKDARNTAVIASTTIGVPTVVIGGSMAAGSAVAGTTGALVASAACPPVGILLLAGALLGYCITKPQ